MVEANPMALRMLPEQCRQEAELVLAAVRGDGRSLAFSPLRDDPEFAREAVCCSAAALEFVPEPFKDRELVLQAVCYDGRALRFAPELQTDGEVVMKAIESSPEAMLFAGGMSSEWCSVEVFARFSLFRPESWSKHVWSRSR